VRKLLIVALLAFTALALPTNQRAVFDGVPLASWPEIIVISLLIYFVSVHSVRAVLLKQFEYRSRRRLVLGILAVLLPFKVLVYSAAPTDGMFEVCYRLYDDSDSAPCSPTFSASPWLAERSNHFAARSSSTQRIAYMSNAVEGREGFRLSNWDNPTINSLAFDGGWWPWNAEDKHIDVFPFRAEYRADLKFATAKKLLLRYVGEGTLTLNGERTTLNPSYVAPAEILLDAQEGSSAIEVDFAFKRTQQRNDSSILPYARLELLDAATGNAVRAMESRWISLANLISDVAILGLVVAAALATRRNLRILITGAAVAGTVWALSRAGLMFVPAEQWPLEPFIIALIGATFLVVYNRSNVLLLLPVFLLSSWFSVRAETTAAEGAFRGISQVFVRLRGNDHLVYHAFSQIMLGENWLRGAESIFHYQPGIRYYFYWLGILFGDGGVLTGLISVSITGVSILFLLSGLQHLTGRLTRLTVGIAAVALLIWWTSSHTIQSITMGLSEFGTWATVLFMTGMLIRGLSSNQSYAIGLLAAGVTWIRPNQGLAMIAFLLFVCIVTTSSMPQRVSQFLRVFGSWFAALVLIPLHNLYFGSQLVFQPTGAGGATQEPWSTVLRAPFEKSARDFIITQLQGLLYLPSVLPEIRSPALALAFPLFAFVFILAAIARRRSHRDGTRLEFALASLIVFGQIGPYFKYSIFRYYPIMLDSIYLSMVAMGLILLRSLREPLAPSNPSGSVATSPHATP